MKEKFRAYFIAIRNVMVSMNILKLSLVLQPRKLLNYTQSDLFFFKTISGKRKLIQKNIFEVLHYQKEIVDIRIKLSNEWFLSDCTYTKDLITLCLICKLLNPKVVFEIGTFKGHTAYHFALNTSKETRIYTLDLPKGEDIYPELNLTIIDKKHIMAYEQMQETGFNGKLEETKIYRLYGDSFKFDYSSYYNKVDFFFIDGAHHYDYVRSDTLNALKCIRRGGVIAWHDYGRSGVNGVSKWLHQLSKKFEIFSVPGSSIAFMVVREKKVTVYFSDYSLSKKTPRFDNSL